jgi:uncharacterized protein
MALENLRSKIDYKSPINLEKLDFYPGDKGIVRIPIGKLPSDSRINVVTHVIRHKKPGPVVLLLAGIHGDEVSAIEILRRFVELKYQEKILKGTLIIIPLVNVVGFINFNRDSGEGKDVNRSFPGTSTGSLASRIARAITKIILPYTDIAIDFHTGGASRVNYPQIRYLKSDKTACEIAKAFQPPFLVEKALIPKSFRRAAKDAGIPAVVFEGGESTRLDHYCIEQGINGILRVLNSCGMLNDESVKTTEKSILIEKSTWVRASQSGLFEWLKASGAPVAKGEIIGYIRDPYGLKSNTVLSNHDGYILGHNNASVVHTGDALFNIGYTDKTNDGF